MMPLWAIRLIGYGLVLAAIGGIVAWWHHDGYKEGQKDQKVVDDGLAKKSNDEAIEKMNEASIKAKAVEDGLNLKLSSLESVRYQEKTNAQNIIADLQSSVRSGAIKLRIATTVSKVSGCAESNDSSASTRSSTTEESDVMPETAATILSIAGDIAQNVRDENSLRDMYNLAREVCNGK